jgi:hypothetical protein
MYGSTRLLSVRRSGVEIVPQGPPLIRFKRAFARSIAGSISVSVSAGRHTLIEREAFDTKKKKDRRGKEMPTKAPLMAPADQLCYAERVTPTQGQPSSMDTIIERLRAALSRNYFYLESNRLFRTGGTQTITRYSATDRYATMLSCSILSRTKPRFASGVQPTLSNRWSPNDYSTKRTITQPNGILHSDTLHYGL